MRRGRVAHSDRQRAGLLLFLGRVRRRSSCAAPTIATGILGEIRTHKTANKLIIVVSLLSATAGLEPATTSLKGWRSTD